MTGTVSGAQWIDRAGRVLFLLALVGVPVVLLKHGHDPWPVFVFLTFTGVFYCVVVGAYEKWSAADEECRRLRDGAKGHLVQEDIMVEVSRGANTARAAISLQNTSRWPMKYYVEHMALDVNRRADPNLPSNRSGVIGPQSSLIFQTTHIGGIGLGPGDTQISGHMRYEISYGHVSDHRLPFMSIQDWNFTAREISPSSPDWRVSRSPQQLTDIDRPN